MLARATSTGKVCECFAGRCTHKKQGHKERMRKESNENALESPQR